MIFGYGIIIVEVYADKTCRFFTVQLGMIFAVYIK